jgi:hypothetical protein
MPQPEDQIRALVANTKAQLDDLMLFGTSEQREQAKKLKDALTLQELRSALADFHARTASLVELTTNLQNVIDSVQLNPIAGLMDRFKGLLTQAGDVLRTVHDAEVLRSAHDTEEEVETAIVDLPATTPVTPMPPRAPAAAPPAAPRNSKRFEDLAAEYQAYFDTCQIRQDKLSQVRWYTDRLIRFRDRYRDVGDPLGIPWYFIGAIHALEGGFNFETHLHNVRGRRGLRRRCGLQTMRS